MINYLGTDMNLHVSVVLVFALYLRENTTSSYIHVLLATA